MNFAEVSSEEEERLLQEHMRLLTEKDGIVRRTEYFNVLEQLREVEDEITKLQHELGSASNIDRKFTSYLRRKNTFVFAFIFFFL